jgi:hypothetical protein
LACRRGRRSVFSLRSAPSSARRSGDRTRPRHCL